MDGWAFKCRVCAEVSPCGWLGLQVLCMCRGKSLWMAGPSSVVSVPR